MKLSRNREIILNQTHVVHEFHKENSSVLDKLSDHQIWNKFKNGDRLAFTYIYSNHVNALYNFGNQFTNDKELVKDSIHDLFVELRKQSGKSSNILSIKSYLYKCLYRSLIKKIRLEELTVGDENIDTSFLIALSPEHTLIDQQLSKERQENLEHSLNQLSPKQRKAVLLYFYDDLSYKEISEIFEMDNVKSARKLIYRALDKLKLYISPV